MPEKTTSEYTTKEPFRAEILIAKESHDLYAVGDAGNAYPRKVCTVEGGVMLKITITAPTLEKLAERINGHVSLIS